METISFHKLHSAGNDFIFIFNNGLFNFSKNSIKKLCDRNFGIGADGIFIINNNDITHYDPDGAESFCANGSLCLSYMKQNGFSINNSFKIYNTTVHTNNSGQNIGIKFQPPKFSSKKITLKNIKYNYVEIGNPHIFIEKEIIDLNELNHCGKLHLNNKIFNNGINISYIKRNNSNVFEIATFERGVNKITNCCGSACSAFSLFLSQNSKLNNELTFIPPSKIKRFVKIENNNIFLTGSVNYVYKGSFNFSNFSITRYLNQ